MSQSSLLAALFRFLLSCALYTTLLVNLLSLVAFILRGFQGWHIAASSAALIGAIWINSVSTFHAAGQVTACTATLLLWGRLLYCVRESFRPTHPIHKSITPHPHEKTNPDGCKIPGTGGPLLLAATATSLRSTALLGRRSFGTRKKWPRWPHPFHARAVGAGRSWISSP
jgi:hypothetical protein